MFMGFPSLVTMSVSVIVGLCVLTVQAATRREPSAEQFQPIKEAEMPSGFPTYTPVGQIEIKRYPAYRKALARGPARFWTLFQHIKSNNVAMTAPVEMDYGDLLAPEKDERSMSFLYERPDQGSPGHQGGVEVVDIPAMTVASIGCRGTRSASAIAEAREKLMDWLHEKKGQYVVSGPLRVMGYNSPFVPREKNFFEVQIRPAAWHACTRKCSQGCTRIRRDTSRSRSLKTTTSWFWSETSGSRACANTTFSRSAELPMWPTCPEAG